MARLDSRRTQGRSPQLPVRRAAVNHTLKAALNLYATTPNAFDEEDIAVAQTLAGYASLATANAYIDNAGT